MEKTEKETTVNTKVESLTGVVKQDQKYLKEYKIGDRIITLCLSQRRSYIDPELGELFYYTLGYAVTAPGDKYKKELGYTIAAGRSENRLPVMSSYFKLDKKFAEALLDKLLHEFKNSTLKAIYIRNAG